VTATVADAALLWLTPHPLQRVGALVVAYLAGRAEVEAVTDADLDMVSQTVQRDAAAAARAGKDGPGSYWQKVLGAAFPNSPATHPLRARRDVPAELAKLLDCPATPGMAGFPCVLCGRPADHVAGKHLFPLVASVLYRNTTAPGVPGWPLCWTCLLCGWAMPYGATFLRSQLVVFDATDQRLLGYLAGRAVQENRRYVSVDQVAAPTRLEHPTTVAFRALRQYRETPHSGVRMLVFRNDNRGAQLRSHRITQRRCAFLVGLDARDRAAGLGLRAVCRAFDVYGPDGTLRRPGENLAAAGLLEQPEHRFLSQARHALLGILSSGSATDAPTTIPALARRYAKEVLNVSTVDAGRIEQLSQRVAALIGNGEVRGPLRAFTEASRSPRKLNSWFRRQAVDRLIIDPQAGPLLEPADYQLLFQQGIDGFVARELLFFAVIARLHDQGWGRSLAETDRAELAAELADATSDDRDDEEEPHA
jgi:CRISPR-associated protein Cst1